MTSTTKRCICISDDDVSGKISSSAEVNESVNENAQAPNLSTISSIEPVTISTGNASDLPPIKYTFADALEVILKEKYCLRNIPFARKDNMQFVIRTTCTINDGCGRWVKLRSETSTKYKNNSKYSMTRTVFKHADDVNYIKVLYKTNNSTLFQYFGTFKGDYIGKACSHVRALELKPLYKMVSFIQAK